MPRKKKTEEVVVAETPKKRTRKTKEKVSEPEVKYFVDVHGDVREYTEPVKQFEIDWDKIKAQVREAAEMIENTTKVK